LTTEGAITDQGAQRPEEIRFLSGLILVSEQPERLVDFYRITAISDPDGNLIELTELGPARLDHLKKHRAAGGDLAQVWQARLCS